MLKTRMLVSSDDIFAGVLRMPSLHIRFSERDTLPDLLERRASELDLTVEQLVKRFINEGMRDYRTTTEPAAPGNSLDDFFVQNGVLKKPE